MRRSILLIATIILSAGTVFADSVDIEYMDRECVVGESLFFNVKINIDSDKSGAKHIDVSKVTLNNIPLKYEIRETSNSSFTVVINGRTVNKSSGVVKNYIFEIPTSKVGVLTLDPFEIKVGNKTYTSDQLRFNVLPKPRSSDLLFKTRLKNLQTVYYPTQVIEIENKIYFRNFPGSPSIQNIHLPILQHKSFSLIPAENTNWEAIINDQRFNVKPKQGEEVINGKKYNFFAFNLKFRLMESGHFSFDNHIRILVETGKVTRQRGFFGTQLVKEQKVLYADSAPFKMVVRNLPNENVPPSFNGAIGDFKIKVIPSSDTDVKVGDPITLLIEISGRGTWEFVKSPPIHKIPEITDYFKVSHDPVPGEVSEDNSSKTFNVRMRVKSKTVDKIPPIPFTFFNLLKEKYVTIYSNPFPISVFDTQSKVSVVDYSLREKKQKASEKEQKSFEQIRMDKEVFKPRLPELIQISDNVSGPILYEDHSAHYQRIIYALIPFVVVAMLFLVNMYKNRNVSSKERAMVKSRKAYKRFLANVSSLEKRSLDSPVLYRDLGRNILTFMEERYGVSTAELNGNFFNQLIDMQAITREGAEALTKICEEVDYRRYSPAKFDPEVAKTLLKKTKGVLKGCQIS